MSSTDAAGLREAIRSEVSVIKPLDDTEGVHQADALAWIGSGAGLFRTTKPATPPKHLVSYFAVVDDGHILLVDHRSAGLWLPTGGHVEPGEHPRVTVERELQEELALSAPDPIGPPLMVTCTETVGLTAGHVDVSLWYVVRSDRRLALHFDGGEFRAARWFAFADVPMGRSDPHLGRFLQKLPGNRRIVETSGRLP